MLTQADLFDVGDRVPLPKGRHRKGPCTPAAIGSGPAGQTCGTCQHCVCRGGVAGRYLKCFLMIRHWTGGAGTDIRSRWRACKMWAPERAEAPQ